MVEAVTGENVVTLYEKSLLRRLAKLEPTSFPWLARECGAQLLGGKSEAGPLNLERAREAISAFGRKRPLELELVHVVSGTKRVKSSFSSVEVASREVSLVEESEVESRSAEMAFAWAAPYCVAPKQTDAAQLWVVDAEKSKALMSDKGEVGEAFRRNLSARVRIASLSVKPLADWATNGAASVALRKSEIKQYTDATKVAEPKQSTEINRATEPMKQDKVATKFASFFTSKRTKTLTKVSPEPIKEQAPVNKTRRRVVDDEDEEEAEERVSSEPGVNNLASPKQAQNNTDGEPPKPTAETSPSERSQKQALPTIGSGDEPLKATGETPPSESKQKQASPTIDTDDEVPKPAAETSPSQRKKKHVSPTTEQPRLVEKTYVDDRGYLVTQKVWSNSSGTAAQATAPAPSPTKRQEPANKQPLNKPQLKPKKGKVLPKGQTSLFGFFKQQ